MSLFGNLINLKVSSGSNNGLIKAKVDTGSTKIVISLDLCKSFI